MFVCAMLATILGNSKLDFNLDISLHFDIL